MVLEHWNTWKREHSKIRHLTRRSWNWKKQENERLQNIETQQIQMFKVMLDQQQQVQRQEKDDVKNFLNLARPATAPTEASSGYAEFVVDATANSNSGYDGFIRETWC